MCWSAAVLCEEAPTTGHEGICTLYCISTRLVKGMAIHLSIDLWAVCLCWGTWGGVRCKCWLDALLYTQVPTQGNGGELLMPDHLFS